ncbi:MAG: LytTR family transcriptional regulator DNA-binding domain-containing protein [Bacteroidota bacterium]
MQSLLSRRFEDKLKCSSDEIGSHHKFIVREKGKIYFYQQSEIERCEAHSNYTKIVFKSGKSKWVSKCLKAVASELSLVLFIRIHAKHLVNREAISHIACSPSKLVHLVNGNTIPIARSKYQYVKDQIQKSILTEC